MLGSWTSGRATLSEDLAAALAELIDGGSLPAGAGLPTQRALAAALAVSRGTVTAVYGALEARGYVVNRRGSGTRIRSARNRVHGRTRGRLFSFTSVPGDVIDLSTGALPASPVAAEVLTRPVDRGLSAYLHTDGYFPAGLPLLRQAVADQYTRDGLPTRPQQIMITAGAQQAAWLAATGLADSGELVLTEEPSYRGALEALRAADARIEGLPLRDGGLDVEQLRSALGRRPRLLYCQSAIHNPTGQTTSPRIRARLAAVINAAGLVTVEDTCAADLTLSGPPLAPTLAGLVDPHLLVTIGTTSKLFWGGLRVGWIRADERHIHALVELRKPVDLACSVIDQLIAIDLIGRTDTARSQRRTELAAALAGTEKQLREYFPHWTWQPIAGGSGLWVDTHEDAVALAERGKRVGVRLAAGPGFSVYRGQRSYLRLPVWHEEEELRAGLCALAAG